jgi:hypothetical protein
MSKVLCSVATRGRYHTTLPLVLNAIINQTLLPDKLIIFDDNDEFEDMRGNLVYQYFFQMLDFKNVAWEWRAAEKKGQHHIHQHANLAGFDWVWRVDDDAVPEPNVLETLCAYALGAQNVGAVGGSVLTPPNFPDTSNVTGKIEAIFTEPNIQWNVIDKFKQVDHLHCTFLYRAGVYDYNLGLSRVAHREETLFTWGLKQKGYDILVVPNAVTWHMKNPQGGIRAETNVEMYKRDEEIFKNFLRCANNTIVVLNCGRGDHVVFKKVLPLIKNPIVFTCYPDIIPGVSIKDAISYFGSIDQWSLYKKMHQWNWTGSLESAFRKMYL